MKKITILIAAGLITASVFASAASDNNMNQMGNMPMKSQSMPMMGNHNTGNMPMMNMMQQKQAMMQTHMSKVETHLANIEALSQQLVENEKNNSR